ncbi:MAG: hypothetical protein HY681_01130 [Chloroflexi bacterium]|nr:hypothetical protein [Chloroflexota bacterium]
MATSARIKVADQVWIAVALLQKETPEAEGFTVSQIKDRVRQEFGSVSPGIETQVRQHCLAEKEPRPGRYRMLTKAGRDKYRLFREGDFYHPDRENTKTMPNPEGIPEEYRALLIWHEEEHKPGVKVFGPEALARWLSIEPVSTGLTDLSVNHDKYLAEDYVEHHMAKRSRGPEAKSRAPG